MKLLLFSALVAYAAAQSGGQPSGCNGGSGADCEPVIMGPCDGGSLYMGVNEYMKMDDGANKDGTYEHMDNVIFMKDGMWMHQAGEDGDPMMAEYTCEPVAPELYDVKGKFVVVAENNDELAALLEAGIMAALGELKVVKVIIDMIMGMGRRRLMEEELTVSYTIQVEEDDAIATMEFIGTQEFIDAVADAAGLMVKFVEEGGDCNDEVDQCMANAAMEMDTMKAGHDEMYLAKQNEVDNVTAERDEFMQKYNDMMAERDGLQEQIDNMPEPVVCPEPEVCEPCAECEECVHDPEMCDSCEDPVECAICEDPEECPECPAQESCEACEEAVECDSCDVCEDPKECDACPICAVEGGDSEIDLNNYEYEGCEGLIDPEQCECEECAEGQSCSDNLRIPVSIPGDNGGLDWWFCDELLISDCGTCEEPAENGPGDCAEQSKRKCDKEGNTCVWSDNNGVSNHCPQLCETCEQVEEDHQCDEKYHTKVFVEGVGSLYCDQLYPEECAANGVSDTCCHTC